MRGCRVENDFVRRYRVLGRLSQRVQNQGLSIIFFDVVRNFDNSGVIQPMFTTNFGA